MKCVNCKKEVQDENVYCIYCGEKLAHTEDADHEYNYVVDNKQLYDDINSKVNEYGDSVKENLPSYMDRLKNFIAKNKIKVIACGAVLGIIIISLLVYNFMLGTPVKADQLSKYLIGQNLNIDDTSYKITDSTLKGFTVNSRDSVKKKSDTVNGQITLDLDKAKVVADVNFHLYYNQKNKKWMFNGLSGTNIKSINPKSELKDSIKDLLKNSTISYGYSSINLNDGLLKDISDIKISSDASSISRGGSALLTLSNGVVESKVSVNFQSKFDLKSGKWILDNDYIDSTIVEKEKISSNLNDEDKKNFILNSMENGQRYTYKYKVGDYNTSTNVTINKDNISDLKVNNFMEYEDDEIRAEIQGVANSGDISKITFSGVVYLDLSLINKGSSNSDVNIDSLELSNVNVDKLKTDILKYKIDDKPITVAVANTLKLGNETEDSEMFNKEYYATLGDKNVKIRVYLSYNNDSKKYEWKLNNFYEVND